MPRDDIGFLDWNIYFHKWCNYSNEAFEMMQKYFWQINPADEMQK